MVDRLEENGMVERRRDPADRRAWQLYLTPKSQKLVAKLQRRVDSLVDDMLCGLTSDERSEFARLLKAVGENLSQRRETARISNG
jgi:DNA-binding MarR family transcriptional regulator